MNFKDIINKYLKKQDVDEKFQDGFAVRFFDPSNGKRFAAAYPNKKDAEDKAAQLKRDGLKDITITKHNLNFKEDHKVQFATKPGQKIAVSYYKDKEDAEKFKKDIIAKGGKAILTSEDTPANATGTAVVGTGDDSSTVIVKKKKQLQSKLMKRFKIKETIDRVIPDLFEEEDEITKRTNQLKALAKKNA